jgi:hypothetical protein
MIGCAGTLFASEKIIIYPPPHYGMTIQTKAMACILQKGDLTFVDLCKLRRKIRTDLSVLTPETFHKMDLCTKVWFTAIDFSNHFVTNLPAKVWNLSYVPGFCVTYEVEVASFKSFMKHVELLARTTFLKIWDVTVTYLIDVVYLSKRTYGERWTE